MKLTEQNDKQIDVVAMLLRIWRNIVVVLLICCICTVAAYTYFTYTETPMYTARTEVYMLTSLRDTLALGNNNIYNEISLSDRLRGDFEKIMTNITITEQVVDRLKLNISPEALSSRLSVASKEETRIIEITVVDSDPFRAANIVNTVREVSAERIVDQMGLDAINLISEARIPTAPIGSNARRAALYTFIASFIICIAFIAVLDIFNDRIRTPDDIEHYLGLSTLGSIPLVKKKKGKRKSSSKE